MKKLKDKFDKWCDEEIHFEFEEYCISTNNWSLIAIALIMILIYCITKLN